MFNPIRELDRRLTSATVAGSPNVFTAADVRRWAVETLEDRDRESARFPENRGQPFWDLYMMDVEAENALFVLLVFGPTGMDVSCGTGSAYAIRQWSDDYDGSTTEVAAAAAQEFAVAAEPLRFGRPAAEAWLCRGW